MSVSVRDRLLQTLQKRTEYRPIHAVHKTSKAR